MEGSVNREPTRIADGSNANVNRIKSCQNADVPNNEDWGLKVLLEPRNKDNIIDIVAVHGIGADPKDTWTIKKSESRVDWLQDEAMLPKLVPNARIMRFGYNARWFGSSNTQHTKTFVRHVSNELLTQLYSFRKGSAQPLIFIAHSFGGLPVIHALRSSFEKPTTWGNPFQSTAGLIFFGVPFRGREGYPIEVWIDKIAAAHIEDPTFQMWPETMSTAVPEGQYLQELVNRYQETRDCEHPVPICCFYETEPSPVGKIWDRRNPDPEKWLLIPESSACLDISKGVSRHSLPRHHYNLQKFTGPEDPAWRIVAPKIEELAQGASAFLETRAKAARKVCWNVPFARNLRFVGRHTQLDQLENTLFAKNQPQKLAVYGLGGMGKTQIALELVYRAREKYPECSIFWMPATNAESLQQAFTDIGQQLGVPGVAEEQADAKKLVQRYLGQDSAGQWLLVVDNVDDMDIWNNELKGYLPRSNQGCVVCTTRSRKVAVKIAAPNVIEVQEMDEKIAIQLLSQLLINKELLTNHQGDTIKLLRQLTFLPLAIVQAAAYINENGIALSDYLALLDDQEQDVIDLLDEEFEDDGRYRDAKNPVATTWLISFDQIQRLNPLAAEYLSFMSCVDPRGIPQSLLSPAQSRKKGIDAIGTLDAYAFISRRVADQAFDVHRLVHLATRNWLRGKALLAQWAAKAIKRLEEVFPDSDHKNRSTWRLYLVHARYVLESEDSKEETEERKVLVWKFAMCLYRDGRYNEAEKLFLEVMEKSKRVLGEEHPSMLTSMANLASTYRNQGRWKEAEELEVQVMETSKRMLGEEHPDTLTSMANLASTYWNQGRWKEAEELFVQVMETRKRVLGEEHPSMLTSMANLASTYRNQGRWKEAEELFVQVMETSKRMLGEEHPDTLTSMANLASTYWNQGRWKEAEELFVQVMETSKRMLGEEHPDTLTSMANLASTYRNQGRWKEAEELFVQVMETSKRVLGEEHPDTLTSMANLASTYRNQGRWKEAEELFVQVMETRKRVLGEEHPSTLTSMANLASTYSNQGRWKEAEELFVQVMETSKRMLGEEHPDTLTSMANLASTYRNQGRWKEAEELFVQVMETSKRMLGEEHPSMLTSMANLASTYWNQGRWKEAEELEVQVMETRKRVLGEEHPSTLNAIGNLSFTLKSQSRNNEAISLLERCFEQRKRILGSHHPDTESSLETLTRWQIENMEIEH